MKSEHTEYIHAHVVNSIFAHSDTFRDAWLHLNGKPKQYTSTQFCREFLGDLPLEKVQELLQTHYPENFI